jgi:hypothetical protein
VLTAVVVIAAVAFVSSSGSPGPRVAAGIGATATTTGSGRASAGAAVADRINFSAADFPAGWSSTLSHDSSTSSQDARVASCAGATDPRTSIEKDVSSAGFSTQGMNATSDVTIVKTAQLARQDLAAMTSPKALACFRWFFPGFAASSAPPGAQIHIVSVNTLPVPNYGEGSFGFRVVMSVTSAGARAVATVDEIGFLSGRLEVSGAFTGAPAPFPAAMESRLMAALARRAAKAAAA